MTIIKIPAELKFLPEIFSTKNYSTAEIMHANVTCTNVFMPFVITKKAGKVVFQINATFLKSQNLIPSS